jgi:hypothetical protein
MGKRQVRRFVVAVAAAVGVLALAAPAGADPTNAPSAITFEDTVCVSLTDGPPVVTTFVVNGGGRAGAHTELGEFQPLALDVTFNGEPDPDSSFVKNNVGKSDYICQGEATLDTPDGPVTIAFTARGEFKP